MGRTYFRLDHTRGGEIECCKWFSREVLASTDKHQPAAALTKFAIFYFVTRDTARDTWRSCYLCDGVLHDEDVRDGAELAEVLPQPLLVGLPRQPAHEQLPRRRVRARGAAPAGLALQELNIFIFVSNIFLLYQIFLKCLQYLWLMCEIFWRFFVGKIFESNVTIAWDPISAEDSGSWGRAAKWSIVNLKIKHFC